MVSYLHPLSGKRAQRKELIQRQEMYKRYKAKNSPFPVHSSAVGHLGLACSPANTFHKGGGWFTESHVAAIAQSLATIKDVDGCYGPKTEGDKGKVASELKGPILVTRDERYLSEFALKTVVDVLVANGYQVIVQKGGRSVPTPVASHRIIRGNYNQENIEGVLITASIQSPEYGGIKTNGRDGAPNTETGRIDEVANHFLRHQKLIKKLPPDKTKRADLLDSMVKEEDLIFPYIMDLENIVDIDAIKKAGPIFGATSLGGGAHGIYSMINLLFGTQIREFHAIPNPTGSVRTYAWNGMLSFDPSDPSVMKAISGHRDKFGLKLIVANDNSAGWFGGEDSHGTLHPDHALCVAFDYLCSHRNFPLSMGLGRAITATHMYDEIAKFHKRPYYEYNVGWKHYVKGLTRGLYALAVDHGRSAAFPRFDGSVWTTEKDSIALNLLMMEIQAVTGMDPETYYQKLLIPRFGQFNKETIDTYAPQDTRSRIASLIANKEETENLIMGNLIAGRKVESVKLGDGIKVVLEGGVWVLLRASVPEDIIRVYLEERGPSLANAVKAPNELKQILGLESWRVNFK